MTAWLRELAGWLLLGVGLAIVALTYMMLVNRLIIEGFILAVVGVVVFRAGVGLLKVAVAARAMLDVKREMAATAAPRRAVARVALGRREAPGRTSASVLPGPDGGDRA